ncbi:hypothetical protein GS438_26180 [Rhodococcus hoagii]|nr:hypothetical protein [Prescottella equi]MBM4515479.1 hypothetical protein [Prescottella equi]
MATSVSERLDAEPTSRTGLTADATVRDSRSGRGERRSQEVELLRIKVDRVEQFPSLRHLLGREHRPAFGE